MRRVERPLRCSTTWGGPTVADWKARSPSPSPARRGGCGLARRWARCSPSGLRRLRERIKDAAAEATVAYALEVDSLPARSPMSADAGFPARPTGKSWRARIGSTRSNRPSRAAISVFRWSRPPCSRANTSRPTNCRVSWPPGRASRRPGFPGGVGAVRRIRHGQDHHLPGLHPAPARRPPSGSNTLRRAVRLSRCRRVPSSATGNPTLRPPTRVIESSDFARIEKISWLEKQL